MTKKLVSPGGERRIPNYYDGYIQLINSFVFLRFEQVLPYLKMEDTVVDFGCGVGWGTKFMSCFCRRIFGIDNSEEALNMASSRNNAENILWQRSAMTNTKLFKKSSIDLVTSIASIEHISREDMICFLKMCFDILKPKGYMVGTTTKFRASSIVNASPWHLFEPGMASFTKIVSPYFDIITLENFKLFPNNPKNKQMEGRFVLRSKKIK